MDINDVLESERPGKFLYYYARNHGRLSPKWERLFLEFKDADYITWYAKFVIKKRWSEAEPILLESKNIYELCWYAKWVIKERWPEVEPIISQDKGWWEDYCQHFNIKKEDESK